jgi:AraC-like DNA-binding protein/quercetin dioxygenase-like cupin family protein
MENITKYNSVSLINSEATIHIFSEEKGESVSLHIHDFIEIVYVLDGSAVQYVNTERYDVRRGDVLFINYASKHSFDPSSDFKYVNICFDPDTVGSDVLVKDKAFSMLQLDAFNEMRQDLDSGKLSFSGKERELLENILADMEREYLRRERGWCDVLKSYMNILFMHFLRGARESACQGEMSDLWDKLLKYIDSNLTSELSLPYLAKKCFYNPSYFSRAFKERCGMSLTKYVTSRRVERAIVLLENGGISSEKIADLVDFLIACAFFHSKNDKSAGAVSHKPAYLIKSALSHTIVAEGEVHRCP